MTDPRIIPLGESAFIIRLSENLDRDVNLRVRAIADTLEASRLAGVTDVVPANSSIGVYFNSPDQANAIENALAKALSSEIARGDRVQPPIHEVPVTYTGADLSEVADACAITEAELIEIHIATEYQVFAIGFAPGFAYLGELDERIAVPRRAQPRTRVPAGSVAIANRQTAIYPFETPGGWNIIGSTATVPFDLDRQPPALFRVGDRVRFVRA